MILIYIFLLVGFCGGWEAGLTDTPTFLTLAGLTFALAIKEGIKQRESEKKRKAK